MLESSLETELQAHIPSSDYQQLNVQRGILHNSSLQFNAQRDILYDSSCNGYLHISYSSI